MVDALSRALATSQQTEIELPETVREPSAESQDTIRDETEREIILDESEPETVADEVAALTEPEQIVPSTEEGTRFLPGDS